VGAVGDAVGQSSQTRVDLPGRGPVVIRPVGGMMGGGAESPAASMLLKSQIAGGRNTKSSSIMKSASYLGNRWNEFQSKSNHQENHWLNKYIKKEKNITLSIAHMTI